MIRTSWLNRWNAQTPYTHIAASCAFAIAAMVVAYVILVEGPSLIGLHALLYRCFETQDAVQAAIIQAFIVYVMVCQVSLALVTVSEPVGIKSDERPSSTLVCLMMPGVLGFAAVFGLSWFSADFFTGKNASNWIAFGGVVLNVVVCFILCFIPVLHADSERLKNNVYAFTLAKFPVCIMFFICEASTLHFTMLLGMCVLDCLLNKFGNPGAYSRKAPPAGKTDDASPRKVRLNKTVC